MNNSPSRQSSRRVTSSQPGVHPRLPALVRKHLTTPWQRPLAKHSRDAFAAVAPWVRERDAPIIIDSYCGTGMSTAILAERNPAHTVIGIDKSGHRLARHADSEGDNYRLVQADAGDFWRQAAAEAWPVARHYLLYPNPWPKPGQVQRRVHGSPAFAALLDLGGQVELRSNWQLYTEEFGTALVLAGQTPVVAQLMATEPLSLFERKYLQSGQQLWHCRCSLGDNSASSD